MSEQPLKAGAHHYRAYVGPPAQYDFMGATQFSLLCALGMRSGHRVLDFGCGSLRAGRFLLHYLDRGNYFGIEPNRWLIDDAISQEIGNDVITLKAPSFSHNDDFTIPFDGDFDIIVAQSIFSHTGMALFEKALHGFHAALNQEGIAIFTTVSGLTDFGGDGWIYPGCVRYRPSTVKRVARGCGFSVARLPWYHPRQTWYIVAKNPNRIPSLKQRGLLLGPVLANPELKGSWCLAHRWLSRYLLYWKRDIKGEWLTRWLKRIGKN